MPLDIHNPNVQRLIESGFSIAQIEQSPTLVKLLNQFDGTIDIDSDNAQKLVGANTKGKHIHIAKGFANLTTVAHELGHATGHYQKINNDGKKLEQFYHPKAYGMARAEAEGEATYYEFLVARELGYSVFKRPLWQDNQARPIDQDVYADVNYLVNHASSEAEIIHYLALLNQEMLSSGQIHQPLYTYDEYNTLVYLNNRYPSSKISNDYQQAMGQAFDWNTYEAKSLANKANNYYGTMGDDVLINNHHRGSVLGQQGQGDLMWGSAGNDVIIGNSGKDILLGGLGNDVLIGGSGNDMLAGGYGNDLYYLTSDFGHDTIINRGGGVDNVYFADRGYDQLTLVSQEKNDLTLSLAPSTNLSPSHDKAQTLNHDQLTIKDFFIGEDNASLNFYFGKGGVLTNEQVSRNSSHAQSDVPTISPDEYQMALTQMLDLIEQKHLLSLLPIH